MNGFEKPLFTTSEAKKEGGDSLNPSSEKPDQSLEMAAHFSKLAVQIGPFAVNIPIGGLAPFLTWAQKSLRQEQHKQQNKVEEHFQNNSSIEVHSFYRNPDGSGSLEIGEELKKAGVDSNKIVLLLNGIVNPQDVVQANPRLARLFMILQRLHPLNMVHHGLNAKKVLKGDTIPEYIINSIEAIQKKLFDGDSCQVFIVRNSAAKDLLDVIQEGREKTVLVVGGHGDYGSVNMTDKIVGSEEIIPPEHKLKAFVQHTCGRKDDLEQEEMGKRFAEQTFGWSRATTPVDFIEKPLNKRT